MRLAEYAEEYLSTQAELLEWSAKTVTTYNETLQALLPIAGEREISEFNGPVIRQLAIKLQKQGRGHSQRKMILGLLKAILKAAHEDGEIDAMPPVPKVKDNREKVNVSLTPEQIQSALDTMDAAYTPIFTFLAFTGCRPGEAMALRWGDVDFAKNEFVIRRGRTRGVEGPTKTKKTRVVPMLPAVKQMLLLLPRVCEHVFVRKDGLPFNRPLGDYWHNALKKAGLPPTASYHLRHSFATNALAAGADEYFVSEVVGHSQIATTRKHYFQLSEGVKSKNLACLEKLQ